MTFDSCEEYDDANEAQMQESINAFTIWRDTQPCVINHRFLGDCLEYFVEHGGWRSATDAPEDAVERYWLSRDAVSSVGDWPRPVTAIHAVMAAPHTDEVIFLITETANGEEIVRLRSMAELAPDVVASAVVPFLESLFLP
jgi:hypothetical protein